MRQYLLMAIAGLVALIMGLFTIPYQGTDYRGQVTGYRCQGAEGLNLYVPQTSNNATNYVKTFHETSLQTAHAVDSTLFLPATLVSQTASDPYFTPAPLPLLPPEAMSEVSPSQLPPLDAGMVNVTGNVAGYRVETWCTASLHTYTGFALAVPYDPTLLPQGFTEDDIQTYVYDKQYHRWVAIQRDSVNMEELLVCSRFRPWEKGMPGSQEDMSNLQDVLAQAQSMMSMNAQGDGGGDSPLDFINAVLKTPEMPETSAYTPTSIKELKAADPLEGLTLMQPPTANNSGTANLSYPIEIPAGRQGMQPNLALTYSSGGGNGWLGIGWDISIPSITVETRWGVPRYDSNEESEVYVYEGEQLVSKDANGEFRKMRHRTNEYLQRQSGHVQFWPRKNEVFDSIVRHGSGPDNYWWSVTHKNGVTDYYGKYVDDNAVNNSCVLRTGNDNTSGAIAHWALAESVDPFGNSVRYYYDIEYNAGISGSDVMGKQIYLSYVRYTSHPSAPSHYSVSFVRKTGRKDVVITANRGFKEVTADILCYAEVKFDNTVVRRYMFYTENARESQYKTRLTDVVRIDSIQDFAGCDMTLSDIDSRQFLGTCTHFDYFDAPSGNSMFGSPKVYDLSETNDNIQSTFISQGFNNNEGKATALGSTKGKSWNLGGTASVGVGFNVCMTTLSVGGNFDYNRSESEGALTMIDLDGDGLADKVFKVGNTVYYRKRLPMADDSIKFGDRYSINGVSDFLKENSSTTTWGLQASAGCSYSGSWPTTKSTTTTYFADVNADGLPDLITEGGVLFNTTSPGGLVTFKSYYQLLEEQANNNENEPITVNSALPCEQFIFDGEVNDSIACEVDWVYDSYYEVKPCQPDQYEPVRVILDSLLNTGEYSVTYDYEEIDSANYQPQCYHPTKFWVYRKVIRCYPLPLDPDVDAVKVWVAQKTGHIRINSSFRLIEDTSVSRVQSKQVDGVRYTVQHNSAPYMVNYTLHSSSAAELYSEAIAKDDYDVHLYTDTVYVEEGDLLFFRLQSQGSRAFDVVDWQRDIQYLWESPGTDQYGRDVNHYSSSEDFTVSGNHYFQAHQTGAVAKIRVHIKTGNIGMPSFLNVWHTTGGIPIPTSYNILSNQDHVYESTVILLRDDIVLFSVNSSAGTNWGAVEIRPHIEYAYWDSSSGSTIHDTIDYYPPVNINYYNYKGTAVDSLEHRLFGPLYRGWGQFAYNNNDTNSVITDSIDISALIIEPILLSDNPDDTTYIYNTPNVSEGASQEEATADYDAQNMYYPLSNATRWIEMQPESRYWAWVGYGNINYMMRDTVTNTRLPGIASAPETSDIPEYDHPVPQPTETGSGVVIQPKTVRKQNVSKLRNSSLQFGIPVLPISTGESKSYGDNRILTDYMDLNGDRYPDVLGEVKVQYSMPWGGIGTIQDIDQHVMGVSNSSTRSDGTTYGASFSMPTRGTSNNPKNAKISFDGQGSLSATLGNGNDNTDYTFMDVNGDGLPDKVTPSGSVALNTGYSFLPYENWNSGFIRNGESTNEGLSFGLGSINIAQASISGGVGVNHSENRTEDMLMDFNGDGLPDMVSKVESVLKVSYNYGNGQWSPLDIISELSEISYGTSYSESTNAGVTVGFTLFGLLKFNVGVQTAPYNRTFSKDRVQLTDINGDGYIDYVTSDAEGNMAVRYNQTGKTNLLRRVTNFTGSTIDMDYAMSQSSFEKPQRAWTLTSVIVADSASPLTGNFSHTEYVYENPHYDRYERMDYGFRKVTTKQYDTDGGDTLYRYTVEEYENRIFNKRGRKTRDCVYDAAGRPYVEHLYDVILYDLADSVVSDDGCARTDVYVASESVLTNYYEGLNTPQITSRIRYQYDNRRNVTEYTHFGDTTHHDEYFKAEISYVSGMSHNLVALPEQIVVTNYAGNLMQKRSATYTSTGKLEQLIRYNTSHNAYYNFRYDQFGNLMRATMPANHNNQRLEFKYQYDNTIHAYPVKVNNVSLGYYSTATYDYRFGKPTVTADINGNRMRYTYDHAGRNTIILAPYEMDSGRPYTIKMEYFPKNYGTINILGIDTTQNFARTYHYDRQHPSNDITTTLLSDGLGRMLQTKKDAEINGCDTIIVTGKIIYDCFGRTIEQYHPFLEGMASYSSYNPYCNPTTLTKTMYDVLDRQTSIELPTHEVTVMNYGFETWGGKKFFQNTTIDALNDTIRVLKSTLGQQVKQIAPGNTVTSFVYDPIGRLTSSTDPSNFTTTYSYDMLGRMTQRIHPDAGTDTYVYDLAGNMTSHTNGKGDVAQYTYFYNQLTDITYPAYPASNVHYTYGAMGAAHNRAGKIVMQEDASGWQEFFYGKMGEVTKNIRTFALPYETKTYTFAMEYEYDSWNRIQRMIYPDGEVVSYGYNRGGMLQRVTGQKNGLAYSYIDSLCYNKFELKERVLYGNGTKTCYHYDILLRMDTLWSWNGTASHNPMQAIAYTYDGVGNITNITNSAAKVNGIGGPYHVDYTYDSLYRMTHAESYHNRDETAYVVDMSYFKNGRILRKAVRQPDIWYKNSIMWYASLYSYPTQGNTVTGIAPSQTNFPSYLSLTGLHLQLPIPPAYRQLANNYSFQWDDAGNMIQQTNNSNNTVRQLNWDAENRLQGVKDNDYLSMYQYDANGERTYKLTGSGYTQIINGVPTRHYALTNATLYASPYLVATVKGYTKHYYAESERIASRIGNGGLACVDTPIVSQSVCSSKLQGNSAYFDTVAQNRLNTPNYTTTHLLDTLYYWKTTHGNNEPDCYWYHPDHLGSASWVTDNNGEVVQYLYYLPWGEDFKNQRRNGYAGARHTFSAKEKDTETGLSYFGSRYYSSDLSIWLSVDPMSDKYPSMSPYIYCANNPVRLVDPNGEEIYEFDENGKYIRTSGAQGSPDQIAIRQKDGSLKLSQEYDHGTINLGLNGNVKQENGTYVNVQSLKISGDKEALDCFKFVADNSNVEWNMVRTGSIKKGVNYLSSSQEYGKEHSISLFTSNPNIRIREHWHSHTNGTIKPSENDYKMSEKLREMYGNMYSPDGYIHTYVYSQGKSAKYNNFIRMLDNNINKSLDELMLKWKK